MSETIEGKSRGLESYVSRKHRHPLHILASVLEAALSLTGVIVVILWASQGSFTGAGKRLDQAQSELTGLLGHITTPIQRMISPAQTPARPAPHSVSKVV